MLDRAHFYSLASQRGQSDEIVPWAESNQGLISVLALLAALVVALIEQRRALAERKHALLAEARALRHAEDAKVEAQKQARDADISQRLQLVAEFATSVRGLLLDIERDLQDDLRRTDEFMLEGATFTVPDAVVIRRAKATAETVNALVAGVWLSPALIRAARQAIAALLIVAEGPHAVTDENFRYVYSTWALGLEKARADLTQGEIELIQILRPPPRRSS